jgi:rhodanese-related sulfurtransferase
MLELLRKGPNMDNASQTFQRPASRSHLVVMVAAVSVCAVAYARPQPTRAPSIFDGILGDGDAGVEISTGELQAALRDDSAAVVLDARPYAEYAISHIPGARAVPGMPGLAPSQYVADVGEVVRSIPDRSTRLILYCNGLHCGRSKRFAAELVKLNYREVRRYQLGMPGYRALGGAAQVEKAALLDLLARDRTAVLVDAREPNDTQPKVGGARRIPLAQTTQAKDDGRLPMTDHNTRIFVIGKDGRQARAVAEAIVRDAFHNVAFFDGSLHELGSLPEPRSH